MKLAFALLPCLSFALCIPLAACSTQSAKLDQLVAIVAELPGANCANGGQAIETGTDTNGNGVLDASEVTHTSYVCAGANGDAGVSGEQPLVVVVTEPAGANCANGGQAIETGLDTNGNGVLDAAEITHTSYVCAGANGDAGVNGEQPLIRVDPEPAGANCALGGSAIHVGIDSNGDGILENAEIQSTTYVCRPASPVTIEGSFVVNNSLDAAQLVGVTELTGDLTIDANGLTSIDLSALRTLGGALSVYSFSGALALPALTSAQRIYIGDRNSALTSLDLSSLATVGAGGLVFEGNGVLASVDLSKLATVGAGGLGISGTLVLASLDLPLLTTVGANGMDISSNALLASVDLSSLATVGANGNGLGIGGNPVLASLDLPKLTTVGGLDVDSNAALASLDLPLLATVDGQLAIGNHPVLISVHLPKLATISTGGLYIISNAALPSLALPLLATAAGEVTIGGNTLLASVDLSSLATLDGALYLNSNAALASLDLSSLATVDGYMELDSNAALNPLSFPALISVTGYVHIWNNSALTSIVAPKWVTLGSYFDVFNNPLLPTCEAQALATQVSASSVDTSGDGSGSCSP